jgi:import inner membrane translocase subunit TIM21
MSCLLSSSLHYLFRSKMSPNRVFDRSLEIVRNHPEVKRRFGEPLKGYGRDHGGHREGRRNFIEHTEYNDKDDGSKRTRVRYNLEGRFGHAFVFAEVSSDMPSGEFVYILVQDKHGGNVITVQDNRAAMTAKLLSGGNSEAMSAMSQLLGGNNSK